MFKKTMLTLMLAVLSMMSIQAQDQYKSTQDENGNKVLIGKINEKLLANDSAFMCFYQGVNSYQPDTAWRKYISFYRDSFDVVVFAGTWDGFSKQLLPAFYRVMMASSYPMSKITLYGMDHQLNTLGDEAKQYNISKVPTIILLHHGKEIGRIEKTPAQSIEANIAAILQNKYLGKSPESDSSGL